MLLAKLISDKSRSVSTIDWIGRISDGTLELLASESGLSGGQQNARDGRLLSPVSKEVENKHSSEPCQQTVSSRLGEDGG